MNKQYLLVLLVFTLLPATLRAQDARAMAVGYAATAAPMGIFGLYWNPALEAVPDNATWTIASGFSAFNTSNTNTPILRYNQSNAIQSGQDPVTQYQQYSGLFAVKYGSFSFGAFYDQEQTLNASQGSLGLLNDRSNGPITPGNSYNLNYLNNVQQIETFALSYSTPLPLGTFPFLSVGGSLKYHYGTEYALTTMTGTYTGGSPTGYSYSRTTSTSGLGLSMDLGFFAKISDMLNVGFMMENIQSSYNWQAEQQNFTLDQNTGQDIGGATSSVTVSSPFPYTTKLGVAFAPPDKNTFLEGEVSWVNNVTYWRGGLEKYYPNGLVIRLGTFADQYSGQQLWTFGLGFFKTNFNIDVSCVTRSIPDLQDSVALGGAIDAAVRF